MLVVTDHLNGVPLLYVLGEVDHGNASLLAEAVHTALGKQPAWLLLDLESCPYLDSGGVSVLLDTLRKVRDSGCLGVIAPQPDVRRILALVGLTLDPAFRMLAHGEAEALTARLAADGFPASAV
jgi:anti-anti-sigma factor